MIDVGSAIAKSNELLRCIDDLQDANRNLKKYEDLLCVNWQAQEGNLFREAICQVESKILKQRSEIESLAAEIINVAQKIRQEEEAAEKARQEAEARARQEAEARARQEAEARVRQEAAAAEKARQEATQSQRAAEEQAKRKNATQAKNDAEKAAQKVEQALKNISKAIKNFF